MEMLSVKNLSISFGGLRAVDSFNITIQKGELYGLIGPNGAGKTTVFNLLTGVYKPDSGIIILDGENISGKSPIEINKAGIARTFQNIRLFKDMTVLDNVFIGNHLRIKSNVFSSIIRVPSYRKEEREMLEKSLYLLDRVGLLDEKDEKAHSLPYGKQRRLEIARALATEPKLLLLDEPAAGMNPQESKELMDFILNIKDEFDLTVFLIEHHMDVVMGICEDILVLDHGELIAQGDPETIQKDQRVIEAYLGVD